MASVAQVRRPARVGCLLVGEVGGSLHRAHRAPLYFLTGKVVGTFTTETARWWTLPHLPRSLARVNVHDVDTALLRTCPVSELEGEFLVPSYQRGYRWGAVEVTRLLDDVYGVAEAEPFYYLQPIVVKASDDGRWELVDGQQRMTTLYLVLRFLQRRFGEDLAPIGYRLSYETRPGSAQFLDEPDPDRRGHNIDFHHMYEAHRCIETWFQTQAGTLDAGKMFEMSRLILTKVAVIWYEAEPGVNPRQLFTRLNVGRIPLTDAELVKALVLTRVKGETGWADHAQEVAAQWDSIERELRNPELWAFVSGKAVEDPTQSACCWTSWLAGSVVGKGRRTTLSKACGSGSLRSRAPWSSGTRWWGSTRS